MRMLNRYIWGLSILLWISVCNAQYEDKRCLCVCPLPEGVNGSKTNGMVFNHPLPPDKCNCRDAVLPNLPYDVRGRENEFCPRCDCKYESRNTTTIKVVVILVMWVIMVLVVYMGFLQCLEPLISKRRGPIGQYLHQTNEEDLPNDSDSTSQEPAQLMRVRPHNVLGRVGHHQTRWKQQVMEQRRNIYDRHTMLN